MHTHTYTRPSKLSDKYYIMQSGKMNWAGRRWRRLQRLNFGGKSPKDWTNSTINTNESLLLDIAWYTYAIECVCVFLPTFPVRVIHSTPPAYATIPNQCNRHCSAMNFIISAFVQASFSIHIETRRRTTMLHTATCTVFIWDVHSELRSWISARVTTREKHSSASSQGIT